MPHGVEVQDSPFAGGASRRQKRLVQACRRAGSGDDITHGDPPKDPGAHLGIRPCPPSRVWGVPTTAVWAHRIGIEKTRRLLFTGDCLSGAEAVAWGLASECAPADQLDARFEAVLARIARLPINQLIMMKLLVNQTVLAAGLAQSQILGTLFDGIARHTPEGYAFQQRAAEVGFKDAVRERDTPFGDFGASTFKG
jgi:enoyl-CoA hydratase